LTKFLPLQFLNQRENCPLKLHACEAPEGWAGFKQYVADNAPFSAQSEPLVEINTVETYCEWMADFSAIEPGVNYDLHTSSYDEEAGMAVFFATYHAKHTGEGGPLPPTQQETPTQYVYIRTMDADNKVASMVKL
jgi:hypothetical protein